MNIWEEQAGYLPPPSSPDGAGASQAQVLWFLAAEYGLDGRFLFELPDEVGQEFLALCRSCVPYRTKLLEQIAERLITG